MDHIALGALLAKARIAGRRLAQYPCEIPKDLDAAFAVQDAMRVAMDSGVVGWKVGVTSQAAREMLGLSEPFCGPMFAGHITASPGNVAVSMTDLRIVEAEIGFRMKQDLRPRDLAFTRQDVVACIGTVHPAFELANKRLPGGAKDDARWLIADGAMNQTFIYGAGKSYEPSMDLAAQQVRVLLDGEQVTTGSGANALGDPVNVLEWLANDLRNRGIALCAGDWVSTGLLCEVVTPEPGSTLVAEFAGLGSVKLKLAKS